MAFQPANCPRPTLVTPTDFVTPADFVTPTDFVTPAPEPGSISLVTPAPEPGSMTSSALREG
jgi:hypothetical protein